MGNNTTKESQFGNSVTMSKEEYLQRKKHFEALETTINAQKSRIEDLTKEKTTLRSELTKIKEENESNVAKQNSMKVDLEMYMSLPVVNAILNTNTQIIELEQATTEFSNKQQSFKDYTLQSEIYKLKQTVNGYMQRLNDNNIRELPEMKMMQLRQLQNSLANDEESLEKMNKRKANELLTKLTQLKERVQYVLETELTKINKEVFTCKAIFESMKSDSIDGRYNEIRQILVEQENILLKYMMMSTNTQGVNEARGNTNFPSSNSDNKVFSLIFCNVPERSVDNKNDNEKLQEILAVFPGFSDNNVKCHRFGRYSSDKVRRMRVFFSSMESVLFVLSNKHKLKNSEHSVVRIYPYKEEHQN